MDDYDVVVDVLEKHIEKLWKMSNRNMNSEYFTLNIMDDIRFYQIQQIDEAIAERKNKKEWVGLTDEEIESIYAASKDVNYEYERAIEAKLKEKNT